jgi:hypothetical protein
VISSDASAVRGQDIEVFVLAQFGAADIAVGVADTVIISAVLKDCERMRFAPFFTFSMADDEDLAVARRCRCGVWRGGRAARFINLVRDDF